MESGGMRWKELSPALGFQGPWGRGRRRILELSTGNGIGSWRCWRRKVTGKRGNVRERDSPCTYNTLGLRANTDGGGGSNPKGVKAQTESLKLHMGRGFYNAKPAWGRDLARAPRHHHPPIIYACIYSWGLRCRAVPSNIFMLFRSSLSCGSTHFNI